MTKRVQRDTAPEALVSRCLNEFGLHHRKRVRELVGTPDIVLDDYLIAVFVHGCLWHQHAECGASQALVSSDFVWAQSLREKQERDRLVTQELSDAGWRVLVLWECHIHASPIVESMRVKRLADELDDSR